MTNRKEFLKNSAKLLAGAGIGVMGIGLASAKITDDKEPASFPWKYANLDPEEARVLAHSAYHKAGCGYAGFNAILELLKAKVGAPYTTIPSGMFNFAGGGVKGWGTLCGALNGASAIINMVCDNRQSAIVINELMKWYCENSLPSNSSNTPEVIKKFTANKIDKPLPQSISDSPLCHISVSKWCVAANEKVHSPAQVERCARLSADVVAKTVELLNKVENLQSGVAAANNCLSCHGSGKEVANTATKMKCEPCHGDPHK